MGTTSNTDGGLVVHPFDGWLTFVGARRTLILTVILLFILTAILLFILAVPIVAFFVVFPVDGILIVVVLVVVPVVVTGVIIVVRGEAITIVTAEVIALEVESSRERIENTSGKARRSRCACVRSEG